MRAKFEALLHTRWFWILLLVLSFVLGNVIFTARDEFSLENFVMPLFFLSGALFPLNDLPVVIGVLTRINPLSYGVDALRGTLFMNGSHFGLSLDLSVLTVVTLLCLLAGNYLFSKIEA